MSTTQYFYNDRGGLSSVRTSTKVGKHTLNLTAYPQSGKGGSTFRGNGLTTRVNNRGQSLGTGQKMGNQTVYKGSKYQNLSTLPAFR